MPGAPKHLEADKITDASVDLSWKPAPTDKDRVVDYYAIERKTAESGRWRQVAKTKDCHITVDGLYPEEFYIFRVVAVNEIGKSEPTNSVDVATPTAEEDQEDVSLAISIGEEPKVLVPLSRPERPTVTKVDEKKVDITWTPVEGWFEDFYN